MTIDTSRACWDFNKSEQSKCLPPFNTCSYRAVIVVKSYDYLFSNVHSYNSERKREEKPSESVIVT